MGPHAEGEPTNSARHLPRATVVGAGVAALLVTVASSPSGLADATAEAPHVISGHLPDLAGHHEVRLSVDGPTVAEMVATLRHHARRTPGASPEAAVQVVLTTDLAGESDRDDGMLAGVQVGSTAFVRVDVGWPERTLVHEVAHVLAPGDGHGSTWRAVYLAGIEGLFGETRRAQEQRRVEWVYDRCYRHDACPTRMDRGW